MTKALTNTGRPAPTATPRIALLRRKSQLRGTCYFELLPGAYQGQCWTEQSVFLPEEVFGYLEPIFERHVPHFDHYAFQAIDRNTWRHILSDIRVLADAIAAAQSISDLDGRVGYLCRSSRESFRRGFRRHVSNLHLVCLELITWAEDQLQSHSVISVLGM